MAWFSTISHRLHHPRECDQQSFLNVMVISIWCGLSQLLQHRWAMMAMKTMMAMMAMLVGQSEMVLRGRAMLVEMAAGQSYPVFCYTPATSEHCTAIWGGLGALRWWDALHWDSQLTIALCASNHFTELYLLCSWCYSSGKTQTLWKMQLSRKHNPTVE